MFPWKPSHFPSFVSSALHLPIHLPFASCSWILSLIGLYHGFKFITLKFQASLCPFCMMYVTCLQKICSFRFVCIAPSYQPPFMIFTPLDVLPQLCYAYVWNIKKIGDLSMKFLAQNFEDLSSIPIPLSKARCDNTWFLISALRRQRWIPGPYWSSSVVQRDCLSQ